MACILCPESDRKFIVHADNARPHTARHLINFLKDNRIETASRPPYLRDLAPSDFYLFGYVKVCLAGRSFVDADEPFEAVRGVFDNIENVALR
jgi:hypothetical protein